jgi:ribosomal protein S18 acetylase RimI-like enzyme
MGEIRIVVEPDFRNRGVGTALMKELIAIAKDSDLEKLVFELIQGEQDAAIGTAQSLGFVRLATIPGYVRDIQGRPHDLLILELLLGKWQEWWEF